MGNVVRGRVIQAQTLAPLAGVAVRLIGPIAALGGVTGASVLPPLQQITWTRQLTGFAGNRWQCWVAHLQNRVPGLTWEQFRDGALAHNPSMVADRLFRAEESYLLPEATPVPPWSWSRSLGGFTGNRWECWVTHLQNRVPGLTWEQFRDGALLYNPHLNADGRIFRADRAYLIPQPDTTPRAVLEVTSAADGSYVVSAGELPAACELHADIDGYNRLVVPLVINGELEQPLLLTPAQPAALQSGTVRSARPDYADLPPLVRRTIDYALLLLGDDAPTYDALPPALQLLCYGARFVSDPQHRHHKDIVCADLVSIALKGAGCDIGWGSKNTHLADHYHPDRGNAALQEIADPNDWRPGDVLVYGNGALNSRAGHVNLYVGAFAGTDRSGRTYPLAANCEVVDASMDVLSNGKEVGTGVNGRTLHLYCLQKKCYTYQWVRRVRVRQVWAG